MNDINFTDITEQEAAGIIDRNTGKGEILEKLGDAPTGGDIDANQYQAEVAGEEAVGGLTPTPEQSIVDNIASSVGVEFADNQSINVINRLEQRDDQRWELDPDSAEDH